MLTNRFSTHQFAEAHCRPGEVVEFRPRPGCWRPFVVVPAVKVA